MYKLVFFLFLLCEYLIPPFCSLWYMKLKGKRWEPESEWLCYEYGFSKMGMTV